MSDPARPPQPHAPDAASPGVPAAAHGHDPADVTHAAAHAHDHAHGTAHAHDHGGHDEHHEVHSTRHYVTIWAILIVLFLISVAGPLFEIPVLTLITAFGVACVKAGMVVKFFIHLDLEKRFVHYFLATSLAFMFLFFFAVAPDVMKHSGTQWVNVAAERTVAEGLAAGAEHGGEHGAAPAHPEAGHEGTENKDAAH